MGFSPKDIWIKEDQIWIGDNTRYYRWFPPTKMQQPDRTPDESNTTTIVVVFIIGVFILVVQFGCWKRLWN
jgi:hypothetical protein